MQIARLGIGSALAGGVLGVAAMVGVGIGVNQFASAQTPSATPAATATAKANREAKNADYLAKLAANLGVSVDALRAANVTTLNQLIDEAQAAGTITADQAAQAKQRVAESGGTHLGGPFLGGPRGGHGPGGPGGGPRSGAGIAGPREAMSAVATFLGIDQQTLMQELMSGKTLTQVAQDHGKSRDELKAELTKQFGSVVDQLLDQSLQLQRGARGGGLPGAPSPSTTPSS